MLQCPDSIEMAWFFMMDFHGSGIGVTTIDRDFFGQAVTANRLIQVAPSCRFILLLRLYEVDGFTVFIHRTVQINTDPLLGYKARRPQRCQPLSDHCGTSICRLLCN